ncbi:hypothetical protein [Streptomyces sp. NPDC014764]|uniref:hypothetical protein n=1 Tax=Streptomyces sp. NPDC014764 TaxID=3364907 RepID=UPI0036FB507F
MVEALCSTSRAHYGVDGRGEERRVKTLADALPVLLSRVTRPRLRRQLLQQADDKQLAELAGQAVVVVGGLQRLPLLINQGHLRELAFTGRTIGAERAADIGLVNDVHTDPAALRHAARTLTPGSAGHRAGHGRRDRTAGLARHDHRGGAVREAILQLFPAPEGAPYADGRGSDRRRFYAAAAAVDRSAPERRVAGAGRRRPR